MKIFFDGLWNRENKYEIHGTWYMNEDRTKPEFAVSHENEQTKQLRKDTNFFQDGSSAWSISCCHFGIV
ncbi:MAG: hypothetical protein LBC74_01405 [Planctomycetaceae bacterium]|nr:hypothetical protein [Planctomycetaceae bacterium]